MRTKAKFKVQVSKESFCEHPKKWPCVVICAIVSALSGQLHQFGDCWGLPSMKLVLGCRFSGAHNATTSTTILTLFPLLMLCCLCYICEHTRIIMKDICTKINIALCGRAFLVAVVDFQCLFRFRWMFVGNKQRSVGPNDNPETNRCNGGLSFGGLTLLGGLGRFRRGVGGRGRASPAKNFWRIRKNRLGWKQIVQEKPLFAWLPDFGAKTPPPVTPTSETINVEHEKSKQMRTKSTHT